MCRRAFYLSSSTVSSLLMRCHGVVCDRSRPISHRTVAPPNAALAMCANSVTASAEPVPIIGRLNAVLRIWPPMPPPTMPASTLLKTAIFKREFRREHIAATVILPKQPPKRCAISVAKSIRIKPICVMLVHFNLCRDAEPMSCRRFCLSRL